jgi:hypothetical protein
MNGHGYESILRGLMKTNAPDVDRYFSTGVTNFLYKAQNLNWGSDLVARNLQVFGYLLNDFECPDPTELNKKDQLKR